MSIFERRIMRKVYLDDTLPLYCAIINAENTQGHTEYVIRVQRGPLSDNSWHIYKRYNDFVALHHSLQGSGHPLPLPPKKLIGNFDREFIAERRLGLQRYLDIVVKHPVLSTTLAIKRFLDPDNYGTLYKDVSLQQISITLRGELNVEVVRPLVEIGWRLRKQHFIVNLKSDPKHELVLVWSSFGPDKWLEDKPTQFILKSYCTLQHANIAPIEMSGISEGGGWVIKFLYKNGSLLDYICGVKNPCGMTALKKYSNYKAQKPLSPPEVIDISSQILQGLAYLHHKGIPYGHLHLGNILLIDGVVKLLDIENAVFGLPSYYRSYLTEHKNIVTMQSIDVYCLGLVMYEMLFGEPLHDPRCFSMPPSCPSIFKPILESILTLNGIKRGVPTISSLLNLEFFRRSPPKPHPYLKLSSSLKQSFQILVNQTLTRLKEDQLKVRQLRRSLKLQEILTADERKTILPKRPKSSKKKYGDDVNANGKWSIRSGSPTSTSTTTTSQGTNTPPTTLSVTGGISEPNDHSTEEPAQAQCISPQSVDSDRSALLGDICNFKKEGLRRVNPPA